MRVEIITSDNSLKMLAQLCEPQFEIGSNYNVSTSDVDLKLSSSLETSQVAPFNHRF
jgi:hypothetical protein